MRIETTEIEIGTGRSAHQDEVEEGGLVHFDELGVEALEIIHDVLGLGGDLAVLGVGSAGLDVPPAELDDLGEDLGGDVGERYAVVGATFLDHVFDGLRLHRLRLGHLVLMAVGAAQRQHLHLLLPGRRRRRRVLHVRHRSDRRKKRVVGGGGGGATRLPM
jgi:hypothetical protein